MESLLIKLITFVVGKEAIRGQFRQAPEKEKNL